MDFILMFFVVKLSYRGGDAGTRGCLEHQNRGHMRTGARSLDRRPGTAGVADSSLDGGREVDRLWGGREVFVPLVLLVGLGRLRALVGLPHVAGRAAGRGLFLLGVGLSRASSSSRSSSLRSSKLRFSQGGSACRATAMASGRTASPRYSTAHREGPGVV